MKREEGSGKNKRFKNHGQTIIEFSFCMIIVFLMAYGLVKIFIWTSRDLIGRGNAHQSQLTGPALSDYSASNLGLGPLGQIAPTFYYPTNMEAIVGE